MAAQVGNGNSRNSHFNSDWEIHDFLSSNIRKLKMKNNWWLFRRRLRKARALNGIVLRRLLRHKESGKEYGVVKLGLIERIKGFSQHQKYRIASLCA